MTSTSALQGVLVPPINFAMVCSGVYRSGYPTKKNYPFLHALRLRSVLYLCPEDYAESNLTFCDENGIHVLRFPTEGNKEPFNDISEPLMHRILSAIVDVRNLPLLIHCNKGKHRTGTVVAALRLVQGWSYVSIFEEYKRFAEDKARVVDQQYIELYYPIIRLVPPYVADWVHPTSRITVVYSEQALHEAEARQLGYSPLAPDVIHTRRSQTMPHPTNAASVDAAAAPSHVHGGDETGSAAAAAASSPTARSSHAALCSTHSHAATAAGTAEASRATPSAGTLVVTHKEVSQAIVSDDAEPAATANHTCGAQDGALSPPDDARHGRKLTNTNTNHSNSNKNNNNNNNNNRAASSVNNSVPPRAQSSLHLHSPAGMVHSSSTPPGDGGAVAIALTSPAMRGMTGCKHTATTTSQGGEDHLSAGVSNHTKRHVTSRAPGRRGEVRSRSHGPKKNTGGGGAAGVAMSTKTNITPVQSSGGGGAGAASSQCTIPTATTRVRPASTQSR